MPSYLNGTKTSFLRFGTVISESKRSAKKLHDCTIPLTSCEYEKIASALRLLKNFMRA